MNKRCFSKQYSIKNKDSTKSGFKSGIKSKDRIKSGFQAS